MPRDGAFYDHRANRLYRVITFVAIFSFSPLCCAARLSPAWAPQAGSSRLGSITVTGSKKFSSDQIAAATGLHIGAMVTRDDLQKGADRLSQLGTFATVQYRFASSGTDVKLEYQVTDVAALPVTFDNFPWFSDDEIAQALKSSVPLFDGTAPEHGGILDDLSAALAKLLNGKGVEGDVSHEVTADPTGDRRVQQFRVEGASVTIAAVTFSDAFANNDRGIQSNLANLVGTPFSHSALEAFEFEQVRPAYLARGFLRVRFTTPVAHLQASPANSTPTRVAIAAPVDPGTAYSWYGVSWTGNSAIRSAQLDTVVPLKLGDLADGMKIEGAWDRARDLFGRLGYLDVNLDAVPQFDDAAKHVSYAVTVTEGPQYRMGTLVVSGLSIEGERRIRDAWKIPLGSLFDKGKYDEFLDAGVKEAFAGLPVHYEKLGRFLQEDPKTGSVDVLLDFQ